MGDQFVTRGTAIKLDVGVHDPPRQAHRSTGKRRLQDVEIWKHKAPVENPLLTEEDGPVYQLRRWYEQFYVDVAAVTPDMTDRFEVEIDTSHAFGEWEKEVTANLAAKIET